MRCGLTAWLAAVLLLAAPAGAATPPLPIDPAKQAYAFDDPPLLVSQLVFGLAHGVTLLTRACLDTGEAIRQPAQEAYAEWLMRHRQRLIDAEQRLARHYFAERADEASREDLARALNLPARLDLASTPERLHEACRTLPAALATKRYDLDLLVAVHRDEQRLGRAIAVGAMIEQCRQLAADDPTPGLDAAAQRWQQNNGEFENAAQQRWLQLRGDEAELRRWRAATAADTRRALADAPGGPAARCRQLVAELDSPSASLASIMAEASARPAEESTAAVGGGDATTVATAEPAAATAPANRPEPPVAAEPAWLILLGHYSERSSGFMRSIEAKMAELDIPGFTEAIETADGPRTRLRAGPFADRATAAAALERLRPHVPGGVIAPR